MDSATLNNLLRQAWEQGRDAAAAYHDGLATAAEMNAADHDDDDPHRAGSYRSHARMHAAHAENIRRLKYSVAAE